MQFRNVFTLLLAIILSAVSADVASVQAGGAPQPPPGNGTVMAPPPPMGMNGTEPNGPMGPNGTMPAVQENGNKTGGVVDWIKSKIGK